MSFTTARGALLRASTEAPILCRTLGILLLVELVVVLLGPSVVPQEMYLSWYLGPRARASTERFLGSPDQGVLQFDDVTGWRNRPGSGRDKWLIDDLGSRSTHSLSVDRTKPIRVLFLGSSLINGGTHVTNQQVISAYCESDRVESVNCGTMLYSLDQMYLAYHEQLRRFEANVVVLGLSGRPTEGLDNRYIPLRLRHETNLPFVKPRYRLMSGHLELLPMIPKAVWESALVAPAFLDSLRDTDGYFRQFLEYERFGQTPLSSAGWYLSRRAGNLAKLLLRDDDLTPLLFEIMNKFVIEARAGGTAVVCLMLPDRSITYPPIWRRHLPDRYEHLLEQMRTRGLPVVDGGQALRQSGIPAGRLYEPDGIHFTPEGNRVLAKALQDALAPPE